VTAVIAEGLTKSFGATKALCGVDFEIERAQVLGVLGPNGAGKTTAVRILTTLLKPDGGRAVVDGIDVVQEPRRAPSVLFLDEPTTGLDPRSRLDVWALIEELMRAGTTTLLTTQYLDEADRLANEIAVIDRGRVIARGTADELKRRTGGDQIAVDLDDPADGPRVMSLLAPRACMEPHVDDDGRTVTVSVPDVTGLVPQVVRQLDEAGVVVRDVGVRRSTLDDVFFALTGHAAEDTVEPADSPNGDRPEERAEEGAQV
jgi:ABC-2 type transport system ATP-binding protein